MCTEKCCRLCFTKSAELIEIFNENANKELNIAGILFQHCKLHVQIIVAYKMK